MIERTGWTWEYIDAQMDLPRLFAMDKFWRRHPPLRDMVQAYLGIKIEPEKESAGHENTEKDLEEFTQMFNAAGGSLS